MTMTSPLFGFKRISDIFLADATTINWSVIRRLLPNLNDVHVRRMAHLQRKPYARLETSISVGKEFMQSIVKEVRIGTAWQQITIHVPCWRKSDLKSEASLKKLGFNIHKNRYQHDSLEIVKAN